MVIAQLSLLGDISSSSVHRFYAKIAFLYLNVSCIIILHLYLTNETRHNHYFTQGCYSSSYILDPIVWLLVGIQALYLTSDFVLFIWDMDFSTHVTCLILLLLTLFLKQMSTSVVTRDTVVLYVIVISNFKKTYANLLFSLPL